ncbi:MAG: hypothetical protein JXK07_04890 [Spirochaetes bacterium]|nr:hypothetical protein [Spirochaetota bacterium]MBN2769565.1 hypothetical protein [Spirochaetota bacterium]
MKNLFLILISFLLITTYTLKAEERVLWWQNRIDSVSKQRQELEKESYYPLIADALEYDLKCSRSFLSDLTEEPGTEKEIITGKSIDTLFNEKFNSIFASEYLETAYKILESNESLEKSAYLLDQSINSKIEIYLEGTTEKERQIITRSAITPQLEKSFKYETTLLSIISNKPMVMEKTRSMALKEFTIENSGKPLSREKTILSLSDHVNRSLNKVYPAFSFSPENVNVKQVPSYRDIEWLIDAQLSQINALRSLDKSISVDRAIALLSSPAALDKHFFSATLNANDTKKTRIITLSLKRQMYTALANHKTVKEAVDSINRSSEAMEAKYKTSLEESELINNFKSRINKYIKLSFDLKKSDPITARENIDHRFSTIRRCIKFMENNLTEGTSESPVFLSNSKAYGEHVRYLSYGIFVLPQYRIVLNKKNLRLSLRNQNELKEFAKGSLSTAPSLAKSIKLKMINKEKNIGLSLSEDIENSATSELALLSNIINNYYLTFSSFNNAPDYLSLYIRKYTDMEEKLVKGIITDEIKHCVKNGSIIPSVKASNTVMDNENKAKKFLKDTIAFNIVRFVKINNQYRSKGINVNLPGEIDTLYTIRNKMDDVYSSTVNGWTINENNYTSVDQRLAQRLKKIYRQKVWEKSSDGSLANTGSRKIIWEESGLSFFIPEGWAPLNVVNTDERLTASYQNSLDNTKLSIELTTEDSETDAVNNWLRQKGFKTVQLGWEDKDGTMYLWKIGRDKKGNIAKILAYRKKDRIIIVSGISTKKRYPFFHNRIDTVFNSLESFK